MLFNGDNATKEKLFQKIFMVPNTTKLRDTLWNNYLKEAPPEYPVKDTVQLTSDIQCLEKLVELSEAELKEMSVDEEEYNALIARQALILAHLGCKHRACTPPLTALPTDAYVPLFFD